MNINELIEKYKAGNTTLEEEQMQRARTAENKTALKNWFIYAKQSEKQMSPSLKQSIWKSIGKRMIRFRIGYLAAAASILFTTLFSIHNYKKSEMAKKEAKLKEAMAMIADAEGEPTKDNIIYEDEMLIIYTSNK